MVKDDINIIKQNKNEVIKNRVFGMPLTKMTRHQRVSFTAMIKIAFDILQDNKKQITFEYPTDDFFEMIGIKKERKQSHLFSDMDDWGRSTEVYALEDTLNKLINKSIKLRHKDSHSGTYAVEGVALVSYFKLTKEKIVFRFDEWVREKIPAINNVYIMKMPIISSLTSGYSVTLFEQLEQRRDFRRWDVPIVDLRLIFGIEENLYTKFSDFRKRTIDVAVNEINEKTNYSLVQKYVKKGTKIDKIIFTWFINKTSLMEFQNFIRTKFVNVPLVEMPSKDHSKHLIKVSAKGLLYNARNPDVNYDSNKAKLIWRWMYENQHLLLMKEQAENLENFQESDFSKYYGCDLILDGEKYNNIVLIQPTSLKNKLKVKFYAGELLVMEEEDFIKSVII